MAEKRSEHFVVVSASPEAITDFSRQFMMGDETARLDLTAESIGVFESQKSGDFAGLGYYTGHNPVDYEGPWKGAHRTWRVAEGLTASGALLDHRQQIEFAVDRVTGGRTSRAVRAATFTTGWLNLSFKGAFEVPGADDDFVQRLATEGVDADVDTLILAQNKRRVAADDRFVSKPIRVFDKILQHEHVGAHYL